MKKTSFLVCSVILLASSSAMAQFNLPAKNTAKPAADSGRTKTVTNNVSGSVQGSAAGTLTSNAPATNNAAARRDTGGRPTKTIDTTIVGGFEEVIPKGLRNGTASSRSATVAGKKPLEYGHIRFDDETWSEMIWREIDAREKMNQSFMYPGKDDNGDQRFFSILLNAIKNDSVVAFSAEGGDDRFRKPLKYDDISRMLKGSLDTQMVQNANNPNVFDTTVIYDTKFAPNPDSIYTFRLREQWIFDKEASRLICRIQGIAPVAKIIVNGRSTNKTLFWIYYPDLRKTLTKYLVYNPKNYAARMTWEDLFESRYFSSHIIKTTANNPNDKYLAALIKDPLFQLLEGENIKERIFNYEQDLWSY